MRIRYKDNALAPTSTDPGNQKIVGRVNSKTIKLALFQLEQQVMWAGDRFLKREAYPIAEITLKGKRTLFEHEPGDNFKFSYETYGINNKVFRNIKIEEAPPDNENVILNAIEDVEYLGNAMPIAGDGGEPDGFMIETFEVSPGCDWGFEVEGGWMASWGNPNPDTPTPGGTTGWGDECYSSDIGDGTTELWYDLAEPQQHSFSFGFDIYGDFTEHMSMGIFWSEGAYHVASITIHDDRIRFLTWTPTAIYDEDISAGQHRIAVHYNITTGEYWLKIDGATVASGTETPHSGSPGPAYGIALQATESTYMDNVWFCPGDYEWAPP